MPLDVDQLITVDQALRVLRDAEVRPRTIEVKLGDADGLRLAEALVADRDAPPFDKSLMDGYAVRRGDTPGTLRVIGEAPAGAGSSPTVGAGEAVAIMTGAPLPAGADAVVPIEHVSCDEDTIELSEPADPQRHIAKRGSDVRRGDVVLRKGVRLDAPQIAAAASVGAAKVRAFARPRVAVVTTGNEIVAIDEAPGDAQIRDSNGPMLRSLLARQGCEVTSTRHCRDEPADVRRTIESAGREVDAVFVAGGMSVGAHDHVPSTLVDLGFDFRVTKLRIKPGKPFVFAVREPADAGEAPFAFGLPGNPVSAFVCTLRLASIVLERIGGGDGVQAFAAKRLDAPLDANGPREFYQPAIRRDDDAVTPLQWKGSADVYTLAWADVLIVRPIDDAARRAGDVVRTLEIPR